MRTEGRESAWGVSLESIWCVYQTHGRPKQPKRTCFQSDFLTKDRLNRRCVRVLCHPLPSHLSRDECFTSHPVNEFSSVYPAGQLLRGWLVSSHPSALCEFFFFLVSFSFISSYTSCITVLQLSQLRGNRRAERRGARTECLLVSHLECICTKPLIPLTW